jgi:hypothetical protein
VFAKGELEQVQQSIEETVRSANEPYRPSELIAAVRGRGFPEELVRAALWFLIDAQRIQLTSERRLQIQP